MGSSISGRAGRTSGQATRGQRGINYRQRPYQSAPYTGGFRNHHAVLLIRAMINAAKADGQIDREEYHAIFDRTHQLTQAEVQFLREELDCPLDMVAFAREIPRGMEISIYKASLAGIRWDCDYETQYLHDLAHALSISHHECNRIHNSFGLPVLF